MRVLPCSKADSPYSALYVGVIPKDMCRVRSGPSTVDTDIIRPLDRVEKGN